MKPSIAMLLRLPDLHAAIAVTIAGAAYTGLVFAAQLSAAGPIAATAAEQATGAPVLRPKSAARPVDRTPMAAAVGRVRFTQRTSLRDGPAAVQFQFQVLLGSAKEQAILAELDPVIVGLLVLELSELTKEQVKSTEGRAQLTALLQNFLAEKLYGGQAPAGFKVLLDGFVVQRG